METDASLLRLMERMHAENTAALLDIKSDVKEMKGDVKATNGRLLKAEIAIAVLKFAVYTIGGSLLATLLAMGAQVLLGKINP